MKQQTCKHCFMKCTVFSSCSFISNFIDLQNRIFVTNTRTTKSYLCQLKHSKIYLYWIFDRSPDLLTTFKRTALEINVPLFCRSGFVLYYLYFTAVVEISFGISGFLLERLNCLRWQRQMFYNKKWSLPLRKFWQ